MIGIVVGNILIIFGILNIFFGIREEVGLERYVLKEDVVKAMSGEFPVNTFINGDVRIKDKDGNTTFYSTKLIDDRIKNLNKVLSK